VPGIRELLGLRGSGSTVTPQNSSSGGQLSTTITVESVGEETGSGASSAGAVPEGSGGGSFGESSNDSAVRFVAPERPEGMDNVTYARAVEKKLLELQDKTPLTSAERKLLDTAQEIIEQSYLQPASFSIDALENSDAPASIRFAKEILIELDEIARWGNLTPTQQNLKEGAEKMIATYENELYENKILYYYEEAPSLLQYSYDLREKLLLKQKESELTVDELDTLNGVQKQITIYEDRIDLRDETRQKFFDHMDQKVIDAIGPDPAKIYSLSKELRAVVKEIDTKPFDFDSSRLNTGFEEEILRGKASFMLDIYDRAEEARKARIPYIPYDPNAQAI